MRQLWLFSWFVRDMEAANEALRNIPEGTNVQFGIRDEAYFNRLLNDVDGSIMKADMEKQMQEERSAKDTEKKEIE